MSQPIKCLPYRVYYLPVLIIAILGIVNALYLSYTHYQNYTDPSYASFCAISRSVNCDTVAQSPWAILMGLPVAIWGVFGYLVFTVLLLPLARRSQKSSPQWSLLTLLGGGYALAAVYFGYISVTEIGSYCILCLLTYGINFGLFWGSWLIHRRFGGPSFLATIPDAIRALCKSRPLTGALGGIVAVVILVALLMPRYWTFSNLPANEDLPQGVTENGYPWIGAVDPRLTIHEYSDYMCFQCKKMHFYLRQLVAQHPDQIRLVHRHFPMDRHYNPMVTEAYHTGSGKMALIALYAQEKGQFWKVNDFLFELANKKENFNTRDIAALMQVDKAEVVSALDYTYLRLRLKHDIAIGIDQGISGTPGFVIDGQTYLGTIPKPILQQVTRENE